MSEDEEFEVSLALDGEDDGTYDDGPNKRSRSCWINESLKNRKIEGEFYTVFPQLLDDEERFFLYFGMSKRLFEMLNSNIETFTRRKDTTFREAISPKEKLALFLRYLVNGDSYKTLSAQYRIGRSTVHRLVYELCDAIIKSLFKKVIPTPKKKDWLKIADNFHVHKKFPNCLGALAAKKIEVDVRPKSKNSPKIFLFALIDTDFNFITIDIGSYGENNDCGIFSESSMAKALENGRLQLPDDKLLPDTEQSVPYVFAADEAFPLRRNIMRPFPAVHANVDPAKYSFNQKLNDTRQVVNKTFGILAQKFRVYHKPFILSAENAGKVVFTTCILHNFLRKNNDTVENDHLNVTCNALKDLPKQGGMSPQEAFGVRNVFTRYFASVADSETYENGEIIYT